MRGPTRGEGHANDLPCSRCSGGLTIRKQRTDDGHEQGAMQDLLHRSPRYQGKMNHTVAEAPHHQPNGVETPAQRADALGERGDPNLAGWGSVQLRGDEPVEEPLMPSVP